MTEYLRVRWHHDLPDEPVLLLSEVEDGWEVRKVERFSDGRVQRAGPGESTGGTELSETKLPTAKEIASDFQFTVEPTTADEFDTEWRAAGAGLGGC